MSGLTDVRAPTVDQGQLNNALQSLLMSTADPIACPAPEVLARYAQFPALDNDAPQECKDGPTFNSWYGAGQVNALAAVRAVSGSIPNE
jgi:hypothetical protein